MKKMMILGLILFAFLSINLSAQEIVANVTVNVEQLTFEARNYVSSMKSDLESYINNQAFTNIDWEGDPIPVEISIALSGGTNNRYSGRIFIASKRLLDGPEADAPGETINMRFFDQEWSFNYSLGASLTYNPLRFDEFTTLIDYYMLLIIGYDLDTYGELDGSNAFAQAKSIVTLGASNDGVGYDTRSQLGEFSRYNLVSELNDMRYEDFRKLVFRLYYDGFDRMAFDQEEALKAIVNVLGEMAQYKQDKVTGPSIMMEAFFETKASEFASMFNGYEDETVFNYLVYLDPTHAMTYEEAKEGKL